MRCTQTGKEHNAMTEQVKLERRKKIIKIILVTVTVLFINTFFGNMDSVAVDQVFV